MCKRRPNCRLCPADRCVPQCGVCQDYKRIVVTHPEAFAVAMGREPTTEELRPFGAAFKPERNLEMATGDQDARRLKSGSEFQKEGKYSRGWWLAIMKDEGASSKLSLMKAAHCNYITATFVVKNLEADGFIRNTASERRPKFELTAWGETEYQSHKSGGLAGTPDPKPDFAVKNTDRPDITSLCCQGKVVRVEGEGFYAYNKCLACGQKCAITMRPVVVAGPLDSETKVTNPAAASRVAHSNIEDANEPRITGVLPNLTPKPTQDPISEPLPALHPNCKPDAQVLEDLTIEDEYTQAYNRICERLAAQVTFAEVLEEIKNAAL